MSPSPDSLTRSVAAGSRQGISLEGMCMAPTVTSYSLPEIISLGKERVLSASVQHHLGVSSLPFALRTLASFSTIAAWQSPPSSFYIVYFAFLD